MIRKIVADALRPGMYVHDLRCSWVDHPFLLNRFTVRTQADIDKILAAGITEVLIDTERGVDLADRTPPAPGSAPSGHASAAGETGPLPLRGRRARLQELVSNKAPGTPPPLPQRRAPDSSAPAKPAPGTAPASGRATAPRAEVPAGPARAPLDPAPTEATGKSGTAQQPASAEQEAPRAAQVGAETAEVVGQASVGAEFREARRVHAESARVVRDILTDARLGKQVCIERTRAVVARMADSILRNPGPLLALCRLKQRDEYTFLHCVAVSALLMVFARAAGHDAEAVREAGLGGLLHDIGKVKVPLGTLNKAGRLTALEMDQMRKHVPFGIEILKGTAGVSPLALQIAAEHHERYDGTGYPKGLKGGAISRIGQMASIVDVYDAMTSDRVYRRGLTPPEALKQLLAGAGTHFAAEHVQLFIKTIGIYPTGSLVMLESGRLAIVVDQTGQNLLQPRVRVVYDTRKANFVPPFDVDLARTAGHGGEDRILRHESPLKWSVDPVAYLLEDAC